MNFAKYEKYETESRQGKIRFKMSEPRDNLAIPNELLGYYHQMFNAILQVNATSFQRREKLLAIINLMNNTRKRYKKNSFYKLCDLLAPFISKNTTCMRYFF